MLYITSTLHVIVSAVHLGLPTRIHHCTHAAFHPIRRLLCIEVQPHYVFYVCNLVKTRASDGLDAYGDGKKIEAAGWTPEGTATS